MDYQNFTDDELIHFAKNNDTLAQDFLINKYSKLIRFKARTHFIIGADKEDVIQEGMIGLFKAICDFNHKKGSFFSFANLCIDRQIFTAIKLSNRKKHLPLNNYFSLNTSSFDENITHQYIDLIFEKNNLNPEELFINKEEFFYIKNFISENLSSFEKKVLKLYLAGKTYSQISTILHKNQKSVDNAIQRIRKKFINNLR